MSFKFERFTQTGGSFATTVSVRKHGSIGLSQGSLQKFQLTEGTWFVVLFYDVEAKVLGIMPTRNESELGAIKLVVRRTSPKPGKQSFSSSISAKSFFSYYDIPTDRSRVYRAQWSEKDKMILLRLAEPIGEISEQQEEKTEDKQ